MMNQLNTPSAGRTELEYSYEETAKYVAMALKRRHKMRAADAEEAIRMSPLEKVFRMDPEMTLHTSIEDWAREIFLLWKKNKQK